jgi:hypothetical protein
MALQFGHEIGDLRLEHWDQAVARGFGAQHDSEKNQWFLPLDFEIILDNGVHTPVDKALVVFKKSEPTSIDMVLPEITITRDNNIADEARILSPTMQYRLPGEGATRVSASGQLGWTSYKTKDKAEPVDLTYTIECWSRYRYVAQQLHEMITEKYPIRSALDVVDSIGNHGKYLVTQVGTSDLTQLTSMTDRISGFSLTIKCEAELTRDKIGMTLPAMTGLTSRSPIPGITKIGRGTIDGKPFGPLSDPNPGPDGLYGTGKPIIIACEIPVK